MFLLIRLHVAFPRPTKSTCSSMQKRCPTCSSTFIKTGGYREAGVWFCSLGCCPNHEEIEDLFFQWHQERSWSTLLYFHGWKAGKCGIFSNLIEHGINFIAFLLLNRCGWRVYIFKFKKWKNNGKKRTEECEKDLLQRGAEPREIPREACGRVEVRGVRPEVRSEPNLLRELLPGALLLLLHQQPALRHQGRLLPRNLLPPAAHRRLFLLLWGRGLLVLGIKWIRSQPRLGRELTHVSASPNDFLFTILLRSLPSSTNRQNF